MSREYQVRPSYVWLMIDNNDTNNNAAGATDRSKYARNIVQQSLRAAPPAWYWYGSFTGLTRFLDMFGWRTVWVRTRNS